MHLLRRLSLFVFVSLTLSHAAEANKPAPSASLAPSILPGSGIAYRDFLYIAQLDHTAFIVRKGEVTWTYQVPGAYGHIQDIHPLANGNLLMADMLGVKEIAPDHSIVWRYDAPPKAEIHTAIPLGNDGVLFIQNDKESKLFLAHKSTGKIDLLFTLPVGKPDTPHYQTRRAVLTPEGRLLIARTDLNKVTEHDETGREVWSATVERPWSVQRLANGNTLVCSFEMFVRELDPNGKTVWEIRPGDFPDYSMPKWCVATRLANGNTLIGNNAQPPAHDDETKMGVQAFEVSPEKKIVWALRSWKKPALTQGWYLLFLDEPDLFAPEHSHFGGLK